MIIPNIWETHKCSKPPTRHAIAEVQRGFPKVSPAFQAQKHRNPTHNAPPPHDLLRSQGFRGSGARAHAWTPLEPALEIHGHQPWKMVNVHGFSGGSHGFLMEISWDCGITLILNGSFSPMWRRVVFMKGMLSTNKHFFIRAGHQAPGGGWILF